MKYFVDWAGRTRVVEIATKGGATKVTVDGVEHPVDLESVEGTGLHSLLLDDRSVAFAARFEGSTAVLAFHDREVRVLVEDERTRESTKWTAGAKKATGIGEIKSVMPGVVKELRVAEGAAVEAKQPLLVLEAMKMENDILAPKSGVVSEIFAVPGQAVETSEKLLVVS